MAFTFDDLDRMVQDMREELDVERAFVHAWGTFSNYAPVMWPISEDLGGADRLKQVVDRVKGYGWLYSSYHSFVSLLEHDPHYNLDLAVRDEQGRPVPRFRWLAVDEDRWVELAKACLPKEMEAIGQNADVTDIAFCNEVGEGGRRLFLVQRSRFANGLEVKVNLGPTPFASSDGALRLPGYGFHIARPDGEDATGRFAHRAVWSGAEFEF